MSFGLLRFLNPTDLVCGFRLFSRATIWGFYTLSCFKLINIPCSQINGSLDYFAAVLFLKGHHSSTNNGMISRFLLQKPNGEVRHILDLKFFYLFL